VRIAAPLVATLGYAQFATLVFHTYVAQNEP
jgi:hypothetical protein